MLKVLQSHPQKEIERFLSRMVLSMLPNPGIYPLPKTRQDELELRKEIINEICKMQSITNPESIKGKTKILEIISNEISEAALHNKDINKLKKLVGQRGILKPSMYNIEFTDPFNKYFLSLGTRPSHIEEILHNPDSYEHLFNEEDESSKGDFSTFLKTIKTKNRQRDFTLIVSSAREGYTQHVDSAWRLYHSEFRNIIYDSPIINLKEFALKYGLEIEIGSEKNKFFFQQTITIKDFNLEIMKILNPDNRQVIGCFFIKKKEISVDIAYAFAIDKDKYIYDLRKHGVTI